MKCPLCGDGGPHQDAGDGLYQCTECSVVFNDEGVLTEYQ